MTPANFNSIIDNLQPTDEVIHIYAEGRGFDVGDTGRYTFENAPTDMLLFQEKKNPQNRIYLEIDTVYFVETRPKQQ